MLKNIEFQCSSLPKWQTHRFYLKYAVSNNKQTIPNWRGHWVKQIRAALKNGNPLFLDVWYLHMMLVCIIWGFYHFLVCAKLLWSKLITRPRPEQRIYENNNNAFEKTVIATYILQINNVFCGKKLTCIKRGCRIVMWLHVCDSLRPHKTPKHSTVTNHVSMREVWHFCFK